MLYFEFSSSFRYLLFKICSDVVADLIRLERHQEEAPSFGNHCTASKVFGWDFVFLYSCYIIFVMGFQFFSNVKCRFLVHDYWFYDLFFGLFYGFIEVAMHNFRCKFLMMELLVCFCKPLAGDFRLFFVLDIQIVFL